jgi:hypothetical protein
VPREYTGPRTQKEFFAYLKKKWDEVYSGSEFTKFDEQYLNMCAEHLFHVFQASQKKLRDHGPVEPLHSDP